MTNLDKLASLLIDSDPCEMHLEDFFINNMEQEIAYHETAYDEDYAYWYNYETSFEKDYHTCYTAVSIVFGRLCVKYLLTKYGV